MGDFKPLEITLSPTAKYTTGVVIAFYPNELPIIYLV